MFDSVPKQAISKAPFEEDNSSIDEHENLTSASRFFGTSVNGGASDLFEQEEVQDNTTDPTNAPPKPTVNPDRESSSIANKNFPNLAPPVSSLLANSRTPPQGVYKSAVESEADRKIRMNRPSLSSSEQAKILASQAQAKNRAKSRFRAAPPAALTRSTLSSNRKAVHKAAGPTNSEQMPIDRPRPVIPKPPITYSHAGPAPAAQMTSQPAVAPSKSKIDAIAKDIDSHYSRSAREFSSQPSLTRDLIAQTLLQIGHDTTNRLRNPGITQDANFKSTLADHETDVAQRDQYLDARRDEVRAKQGLIRSNLRGSASFLGQSSRDPQGQFTSSHQSTVNQPAEAFTLRTPAPTMRGKKAAIASQAPRSQPPQVRGTAPRSLRQGPKPMPFSDAQLAAFIPTKADEDILAYIKRGFELTDIVHLMNNKTGTQFLLEEIRIRKMMMEAKAQRGNRPAQQTAIDGLETRNLPAAAPDIIQAPRPKTPAVGATIPAPVLPSKTTSSLPSDPQNVPTLKTPGHDTTANNDFTSVTDTVIQKNAAIIEQAKIVREREEELEKSRKLEAELAEQKRAEKVAAELEKARKKELAEQEKAKKKEAAEQEKARNKEIQEREKARRKEANTQRLIKGAAQRRKTANTSTAPPQIADEPEVIDITGDQPAAQSAEHSHAGDNEAGQTGQAGPPPRPKATPKKRAPKAKAPASAPAPTNAGGYPEVAGKTVIDCSAMAGHDLETDSQDPSDSDMPTQEQILDGDVVYNRYIVKRKSWPEDDEPEDDEDTVIMVCGSYASRREANVAAAQEIYLHAGIDDITINAQEEYTFHHQPGDDRMACLLVKVANGHLRVWVEREVHSKYKSEPPKFEKADFFPRRVFGVKTMTEPAGADATGGYVGIPQDVGGVYMTLGIANTKAVNTFVDKTLNSKATRIDDVKVERNQAVRRWDERLDKMDDDGTLFCEEMRNARGDLVKVWVEEKVVEGARN